MAEKVVLITGASGNLGGKLRRHLEGRYPLRLLDRDPAGDPAVIAADLAVAFASWAGQFEGAHTVFHFAADPTAKAGWPALIAPNVDALVNVYLACARAGVRRVVCASSNHVMGGYKDDPQCVKIDERLPPRPGTRYVVDGEGRDSTPYGTAKLFGERLGRCFSEAHGLSVIAVRLGWVRPGDNRAADVPATREAWFRLMWLSNRDFCQLMERCLLADETLRFAVVNGMSANTGMPWSLEEARRLLGYEPQDDVMR